MDENMTPEEKAEYNEYLDNIERINAEVRWPDIPEDFTF